MRVECEQHETMVENRFQGDKLWFKLITPL